MAKGRFEAFSDGVFAIGVLCTLSDRAGGEIWGAAGLDGTIWRDTHRRGPKLRSAVAIRNATGVRAQSGACDS